MFKRCTLIDKDGATLCIMEDRNSFDLDLSTLRILHPAMAAIQLEIRTDPDSVYRDVGTVRLGA